MSFRPHRALAALGIVALALLGPAIAQACGSFFGSDAVAPERKPSLAREQVLLIHDTERNREHFIREVAFRRASEPFGFVVPTPTRPEVGAIEHDPFVKLRERFPIHPRPRGDAGASKAASGAGVEVLEVSKVGSFTAFVLAADDSEALGKWLADNHLVSDAQTDAWLAHYVELGFFYVALRYDPPREAVEGDEEVVAEVVRISFDTPLPYYPYLEPSRALDEERSLEIWYVGTERVVPVALRQRSRAEWVQPLRRGAATGQARWALEETVDPEIVALLPSGSLVVQTFEDLKRSREGFGDVVFAYAEAKPLTPELEVELEPMLKLLDPALAEAKP